MRLSKLFLAVTTAWALMTMPLQQASAAPLQTDATVVASHHKSAAKASKPTPKAENKSAKPASDCCQPEAKPAAKAPAGSGEAKAACGGKCSPEMKAHCKGNCSPEMKAACGGACGDACKAEQKVACTCKPGTTCQGECKSGKVACTCKPGTSCQGECQSGKAACDCKTSTSCDGACKDKGAAACKDDCHGKPAAKCEGHGKMACACAPGTACEGECKTKRKQHDKGWSRHFPGSKPYRARSFRYMPALAGAANQHLVYGAERGLKVNSWLSLGGQMNYALQLGQAAPLGPWLTMYGGFLPKLGTDLGPVRADVGALLGGGAMFRTNKDSLLEARALWTVEPRLDLGWTSEGKGYGISAGYLLSNSQADFGGPSIGLRMTWKHAK
ncbi:MAG: hypothetical protein VKP62_02260 [Candidatus Sericytochromatia bacterium]|nr:hypothetical protein [Candidatus Sericytochromatia bacterium]